MARFRILVPLLVLACGLAVYSAQPTVLETLRHQAFDQPQRVHPRHYQDAGVRVVDLDDGSLARIGQWPWPRAKVAELVDRLHRAGVAAIAFEVAFAEPDRTAPSRLLETWPQAGERSALREELLALPDPDAQLAASFAHAPVVTGFFLGLEEDGRVPVAKPDVLVGSDRGSSRDPLRRVPRFRSAVSNLPALEMAARGHGSANGSADPDGLHRRIRLLYRVGDALLPGLGLEALRVAIGGGERILVRAEDAYGDLGLSEVALPPRFRIPTDPSGAVWLHYADDWKRRTLPAWRVLEGELSDRELDGTLVFVGTSAVGLWDQRPAPPDPYLPGVMLHAEHGIPDSPRAYQRTGFETTLGTEFETTLSPSHRTLLALGLRNRSADKRFYSHYGPTAAVQHTWLPGGGQFVVGGVSLDWNRYKDAQTFLSRKIRRALEVRSRLLYGAPLSFLTAGLLGGPVGAVVLSLSGEYLWVSSNLPNFTYDNLKLGFLVTRRWDF